MAADRKSPKPTYRIVLMGDPYCGKTSLIARYAKGRYDPNYLQTIGSDYQKRELTLEKMPVTVYIYDTAGQEDMKTVIKSVYRNAHGVMLVFDLTRYTTLRNIPAWLKLINMRTTHVEKAVILLSHAGQENTEPDSPEMILVGNKSDLPVNEKHGSIQERAIHTAQENSLNYHRVSAKTNINVTTAFEDLIRKIHDHHRKDWAPFTNGSFQIGDHDNDKDGESSKCCNQT